MPNTDVKINYYLRPQKSIERKMFCHLFRELNSILNLKDYRYIGMGAKYFADFMVFHREFGFNKMISIEADKENMEKYEFNKPLNCIEMEYNYSSEALRQIDWVGHKDNIIWMDYDEPLKEFMLEDIKTIISKSKSGSMFFFTYNSILPKNFKDRLRVFRDNLGGYCPPNVNNQDLTDKNKDKYIKQIIDNVIDNCINIINNSSNENDKLFYEQLVYFLYRDGAEMITIGGILLNKQDKEKFDMLNLSSSLDFVVLNRTAPPYSLVIPPLTYKEINALLQQLPCTDITQIKLPGLKEEQLRQIAKLYRYYPFYMEAASFN